MSEPTPAAVLLSAVAWLELQAALAALDPEQRWHRLDEQHRILTLINVLVLED